MPIKSYNYTICVGSPHFNNPDSIAYLRFQQCMKNEEQENFFKKYGIDSLYTWIGMDAFGKDELERVKKIYLSFWNIYYEHYEDLILYAIMYRNKQIGPRMDDILSVNYFVSKQNEIMGYKQKIINSAILQEKVALLYFKNKNIFMDIFSKYINSEIQISSKVDRLTVDMIYRFRENERPNLCGISNLTDEECMKILSHQDEILKEYQRLYNVCLKNYVETTIKEKRNQEIFFQEKFIPTCGIRLGIKIINIYNKIGREEDFIKRINSCPKIPRIDESMDYTLSWNEFDIVNSWCRKIAEIQKKEREEEEEREMIIRKQKEEQRRREEERRKKEEEERQAKYRYNQRNWHYRDASISFDKDKHIYTVNGKVLDSVTTLVNNAFPKFNPQEHAKYTAAKKGMTVQEVIDLWEMNGKESRELGTLLHEKIEKHYQGVNSPDDPTFRLFKMFAKVIELKPYRTEWSVYDYDLGIAGSIDFVDNQNGEYSIYDWKRSERLIVNGLPAKINPYGEKGNYPLEHIDNSPYYHYALQLSIYKYILEHNYNMKIVHLRLGIFHPSYMKPYLLEMPYLEDEVNTLFNLRSEIIF